MSFFSQRFVFALSFVCLFGCGLHNSASTSSADSTDSADAVPTVTGSVQVPATAPANLRQALASIASAPLGLSGVVSETGAAEGVTVELLSWDMRVLETSLTDASGEFSFATDWDELLDASGGNYVFFIRSTSASLVEMATVGRAVNTASEDPESFSDLTVNPGETLKTLLNFAGTGFNPLTANAGDAMPENLDLVFQSAVNGALVENARNALAGVSGPAALNGQTLDGAIMAMLVSIYELTGDDAGELSAGEVLYAVVNYDPDGAAAAFIGEALQGVESLEGFDPSGLENGASALGAWQAAVSLWDDDAAFVSLLEDGTGRAEFFVGAGVLGRTVAEFQSLNASAELFAAQRQLVESVAIGAFSDAQDLSAATLAFAELLNPELLMGLAGNEDMMAGVKAITAGLFDDAEGFDPRLVEVIADSFAAKADDAAYWSGFVSDDGVNAAAVQNLTAFFATAIESDALEEYFAGTQSFDWDSFVDDIDLTQDWHLEAAEFESLAGDLFDEHLVGNQSGVDEEASSSGESAGDALQESDSESAGSDDGDGDASSEGDPESAFSDDGDGDGIIDTEDNCPQTANANQADTTHDSQGDACDDSDADGMTDDIDNCILYSNTGQTDADENGIGDACEDGIAGAFDNDNDTIWNSLDNCVLAANPDQEDWDLDGVGDVCDDFDSDDVFDTYDNCLGYHNPDQSDADGDGYGDACDGDYDTDEDGFGDYLDNCPFVANSNQAESGFNGAGDACDDIDEDGVSDITDNCMIIANADQADDDLNGVGDACAGVEAEADPDNDYFPNEFDNCPAASNNDQDDCDGDNEGDTCDVDADCDEDGRIDGFDNCPSTINPDQENADNDASGDACDNCPGVANSDQTDSDEDGIGDACE